MRPPPTAGPRLRNRMFSSGSLFVSLADLVSAAASEVLPVVFSWPSAAGFSDACALLAGAGLERPAGFPCAVNGAVCRLRARAKTKIDLTSVFIGRTPADSRKVTANHTATAASLQPGAGPTKAFCPYWEMKLV